MSRNDLARIQHQLKEAIQAHHVMVSKLKADPNNAELKTEVKRKQAEIASLCDKQKQSVQLVHQEFIVKKPPNPTSNERLPPAQQPQPPGAGVASSKTGDGNGTVLQAGGKKSGTAVLKVPQFHTSGSTPPAASAVQGRPVLLVNQSKDVTMLTVPIAAPDASAPAVTSTTAMLPPATTTAAAGGSGSGGGSANMAVPPIASSSMLDGSSIISAYSRLSDAHFLAIAQNTLKRATSPTARRKLEFLAAVDLIPTEAALELQRKRTERKRRTTANPQFSYQDSQAFEAKKHVYLSNASGVKRPRGRPPSRPPLVESRQGPSSAQSGAVVADDAHDDFCAVCRRSGELLLCDTCNLVYHLECLSPPLSAVPDGNWSCPKCIALRKPVVGLVGVGSSGGAASRAPGSSGGKSSATNTVVATVQAFIEQKAAREEEKLILLKHNAELTSEKQRLESRVDHLSDTVAQQMQRKSQLRASQVESQRSIQQITDFVRILQN